MIIKVRSVNKRRKQAPLLATIKDKVFPGLAGICVYLKKSNLLIGPGTISLYTISNNVAILYQNETMPCYRQTDKKGLCFHQRKHPNLDIGHLQRAYQASLCSPMAGRTFQSHKVAVNSNSTMILALFDVLVQALKFWHTEDYCLLVYQTVLQLMINRQLL